ncbi:hypothetical protein [Actinophytocola sp.]|uniref:hypothetical protein n=1 Tax=Actinophytocola sp. TaxID=1872138 RepID=UPI002D7E3072|nr:hypothetical protein [Actinophytocola sp.]HET9141010.1 hypothetical protein [Actinophytocola sp.]HEU5108207.1 hypothetical protein [Micromonosporaceae bacterium]
MVYLLALIGAIAVLVLLWRAFVARPASVAPRRRSVAPDDDPEFLRDLERKRRRPDEDDGGAG